MTASSAPLEDSDPFADRRLYPRVPVALPASVQAGGERHSVHLLDVSTGGAKLKCAARLEIGAVVTLDCGVLGRAAEVRWQNGELVGVRFEKELEARDVEALTERSQALADRRSLNPR